MENTETKTVAIIGGGPAGLIAAEKLSAAGIAVTVFDRMPSVGRKFLMAGRGGLNLTHSEKPKYFLPRYSTSAEKLEPMLRAFSPKAVREWAEGLGQTTFVGSSGRVFPNAMKASPLLRAWLQRLDAQGVKIRTRMHWQGWDESGALVFQTEDGAVETFNPDATLLALGGVSWPRLGGDVSWSKILRDAGAGEIVPFTPSNSGARVEWSPHFAERFAGSPLKNAAFSCGGQRVKGEAILTAYGIEGGAIYALSGAIRDQLYEHEGIATVDIDLRPDQTYEQIRDRLAAPRNGKTLTTFLRQAIRLGPAAINLLIEIAGEDRAVFADPHLLTARIKCAPLRVTGLQGLERAISSAGGLSWKSVDKRLMLHAKRDVFAAGEMLDWDAPTGGYLLQACLSSGVWAAKSIQKRLSAQPDDDSE
ncbi:MAG: TIGR03862 family flavoprotein [Caulobacterales bacterium]